MVLHRGDDDLITLVHKGIAERRCHQVDGFGGATRENDFLGLGSVDELSHLLTRRLMQICCLLRQEMNATMHIGVDVQVFIAHRIQHTQRLLRRSAVVEIDQRFTIHLALQDREILSYLIDIIHIFLFSVCKGTNKRAENQRNFEFSYERECVRGKASKVRKKVSKKQNN